MRFKKPDCKEVLAWAALISGLTLALVAVFGFVLNRSWLPAAPIGIGLALPSSCWLMDLCMKKKADLDFATKQANREKILPLLTQEDRETVLGWELSVPSTQSTKSMRILLPVAAIVVASAVFFLPKGEEPTTAPSSTTIPATPEGYTSTPISSLQTAESNFSKENPISEMQLETSEPILSPFSPLEVSTIYSRAETATGEVPTPVLDTPKASEPESATLTATEDSTSEVRSQDVPSPVQLRNFEPFAFSPLVSPLPE